MEWRSALRGFRSALWRDYSWDWLTVALLIVLNRVLKRLPHFERTYDNRDSSLKFPLQTGYISHDVFWSLVLLPPPLLFGLCQASRLLRGDIVPALLDWHQGTLTFYEAYTMNSTLKHLLERVGRLRPTWLARLETGDAKEIRDGRESFPSGHAAYIFASCGVISLYLLGRGRVLAAPPAAAFPALLTCLLPVLAAVLITLERVVIYDHHFSDTIAGALIGSSCALLAYALNYPSLLSAHEAGHPKLRRHAAAALARSEGRADGAEGQGLLAEE